jgi:hypothetical protein
MLDRLTSENKPSNQREIEEYRNVCREIEDEIISMCYYV